MDIGVVDIFGKLVICLRNSYLDVIGLKTFFNYKKEAGWQVF